MRLKQVLFGAVLTVLACPGISQADIIDFRRTEGLRTNISVSLTGVYNNLAVSAGELVWDWITPTPSGFSDIFFTYCVDLLNTVRDPQTVTVRSTEEYNNPSTAAGGIGRAAYLLNLHAAAIHTSGTAAQAAGLQAAIWEVLYDDTFSLTGGDFRLNTNGAVRTAANFYLGTLADGSGGYHSSTATWLDTVSGQDQMTFSVSEPSTLLMLGTAMLIAAGRLRRPSRKNAIR